MTRSRSTRTEPIDPSAAAHRSVNPAARETQFYIDEDSIEDAFDRGLTGLPQPRERNVRIKSRRRLPFETLSPFPHCALPAHFFERYSK